MSMTEDLPEPARWSDSPPEGETAEHAIGATLRRVREATEPSDTALARAARRVDAAAAARTRGQLLWRLAIAAALIMATGSAVGAALNRWRRANAEVQAPAAPPAGKPAGAKKGFRHRRWPMPAAAEAPKSAALEAPAEAPVPELPSEPQGASQVLAAPPAAVVSPLSAHAQAPAEVSAPAPVRARAPERHANAEAPASVGAELVASAFRNLRSRGDAAAALQSLDEYDRRFPRGVLRSESRVARVEALLTLDRRREALRLLEAEGGSALTRDVRVTRGELLIESDRCADALRDFDSVLAARDSDAAGGRALYGRAGCRLRSGDDQGARRDLVRYLAAHADGPSAVAARRALAALP